MNCVISFSQNGREAYTVAMHRMAESVIRNVKQNTAMMLVSPDAGYTSVGPIPVNPWLEGMPQHKDVPYGFKPWLFKAAADQGFENVLWCDSTIFVVQDLQPIFDIIERKGVFAGDNPGCPQRTWCSDDALDMMGCPRDADFNQIMACSLGISFKNPVGRKVFDEWWKLCNDGVTFAGRGRSTRPDFRDHRHDQAAMSWLLEKHGIEREPYGLISYWCDREKFPQAVLCNRGVFER
jgi:hypothetical protein